jgi:hypothetical protein
MHGIQRGFGSGSPHCIAVGPFIHWAEARQRAARLAAQLAIPRAFLIALQPNRLAGQTSSLLPFLPAAPRPSRLKAARQRHAICMP